MRIVSRRSTVAAAALGTAAVAVPTSARAATADTAYVAGSFPATPVLPAGERHLLNRFSYGVTPALRDEVLRVGARAWFEQQLSPVADGSDAAVDWWPDLHRPANELWQRAADDIRGGWEVMNDFGRRTLLRRITTPWQVREVMTEFWEHHFHVPTNGDPQFTHRASYGDTIRARALGSFEELLQATITHPAMTIFLSGYDSTKTHPNENLGRELLELHTVGVGNHSEDDVKNAARILTGYDIAMWTTFAASYRTRDHWTGPVQVLGFTHPNADVDGRPVVAALLSYLARHPLTARRVARRLVTKFVADEPPAALVERLAEVYLANDTRIVPVLLALVDSPEFAAATDTKLRTPSEDLVATWRLLGATIAPPVDRSSAANAIIWQAGGLGDEPMAWPRPDGAPLVSSAWGSPSRMLASMDVHWSMAGGWWPSQEATYRKPAEWAPVLPVVFRDLVDHLARLLHGRPSTPSVLEGACLSTGYLPDRVVKATDSIFTWKMPHLLVALLDHPTWYRR